MEDSTTKLLDSSSSITRPVSVRTQGLHNGMGNNHGTRPISTDSSMFPSVLDWSLVLAELDSSDFDLLEQYLRKLQLNLLEMADENGFTLLHHAVMKGHEGKV